MIENKIDYYIDIDKVYIIEMQNRKNRGVHTFEEIYFLHVGHYNTPYSHNGLIQLNGCEIEKEQISLLKTTNKENFSNIIQSYLQINGLTQIQIPIHRLVEITKITPKLDLQPGEIETEEETQ